MRVFDLSLSQSIPYPCLTLGTQGALLTALRYSGELLSELEALETAHTNLDFRSGSTGACSLTSSCLAPTTPRMGRGENMGHLTQPGRKHKMQQEPQDVEPLIIRFLRTFKEILKFVLFSYTVLFGALLLARWTTYFMVGK